MKTGRIAALAGVAIATAVWASTASGATLIGDYQFQGTRASSGPGAPVSDVGGANSFLQDTVMGVPRQVLVFPLHSGVQVSPAGLGGGTSPPYSAVTTFRLDRVDSYRRILDPSNGTSDDGFYMQDGHARYSGIGAEGANVVFAENVYATVAITSLPSPAQTKFYVNGSLQIDYPQTEPVLADTLRFLKDNDTGGNPDEDSIGAVSCIRVYNGVLTDAEVASIGASPTCGTVSSPTPPVTTTKKCKKHKRKHRAVDAKKKKCKKHKKKR